MSDKKLKLTKVNIALIYEDKIVKTDSKFYKTVESLGFTSGNEFKTPPDQTPKAIPYLILEEGKKAIQISQMRTDLIYALDNEDIKDYSDFRSTVENDLKNLLKIFEGMEDHLIRTGLIVNYFTEIKEESNELLKINIKRYLGDKYEDTVQSLTLKIEKRYALTEDIIKDFTQLLFSNGYSVIKGMDTTNIKDMNAYAIQKDISLEKEINFSDKEAIQKLISQFGDIVTYEKVKDLITLENKQDE